MDIGFNELAAMVWVLRKIKGSNAESELSGIRKLGCRCWSNFCYSDCD